MLEKMAKKKKAELLPCSKAKQQTYHSTDDGCSWRYTFSDWTKSALKSALFSFPRNRQILCRRNFAWREAWFKVLKHLQWIQNCLILLLYDVKNYAGLGREGREGVRIRKLNPIIVQLLIKVTLNYHQADVKFLIFTPSFTKFFPDIDECSTNAHSCGVNAACNNTIGSYVCTCEAGYSGDGRTCTGKPFWSFCLGDLGERKYC